MHIIALDIGSNQTRCALADIDYHSKSLELLGFSQKKSSGVKLGTIIDPAATKEVIDQVIDETIDQAMANYKSMGLSKDDIKISCIWSGINGSIKNFDDNSAIYNVTVTSGKITNNDIDRLHEVSIDGINREQNKHIFFHEPIAYYVDDDWSVPIDYPAIGLVANKLSLSLKVFAISSNNYSNIDKCMPANIKQEFVPSSFAAAHSCIDPEMHNTGCVLVDIGSEATYFCVIEKNKLLHTGSIKLGSQNLTDDIAKFFHVSNDEAERIKIGHGSFQLDSDIDSSEVRISYCSGQSTNISKGTINDVMCRAFDSIIYELFNSLKEQELAEYSRFFVFTGKITNTLNFVDRAEETLEKLQKKENKHNLPSDSESYSKKLLNENPSFKCYVGSPNSLDEKKTFSIKNICKKAKEYNLLNSENSVVAGLLILAFKNYTSENITSISTQQKNNTNIKKVRAFFKKFL